MNGCGDFGRGADRTGRGYGVSAIPAVRYLNLYDALYKYSDKITPYYDGSRAGGRTRGRRLCPRHRKNRRGDLATSGPGATNLVTGIATAYMDSIPMVAITGNVGTPLIGRDSFQEVYIAGITMPITKAQFRCAQGGGSGATRCGRRSASRRQRPQGPGAGGHSKGCHGCNGGIVPSSRNRAGSAGGRQVPG